MIPIGEKLKWKKWLTEHPTGAESVLLREFKNHPSYCDRFEFQAIVCGFIVDFYFPKIKFAIEVDGSIHKEREVIERDILKTSVLRNHGIRITRVSNSLVFSDLRKAMYKISNNYIGASRQNRKPILDTLKKRKSRNRFAKDHSRFYKDRFPGKNKFRRKSNPAGTSSPKTVECKQWNGKSYQVCSEK